MTTAIHIELTDHVLHLQLARPERKNALTNEMYSALARALSDANEDPAVRAVVITGQGDVFCAGNDLGAFLDGTAFGEPSPVLAFLHALADMKRPLIAGVQGAAVGVGTTMLLHCDYVVMSPTARLRMPFVQLGAVPEAGSSALIPALVGHRRAFAWLVLGEWISAEEAVQTGIANRIADEDVAAAALAVGARVAKLPAGAVDASLSLLRERQRADLHALIDHEATLFKQQLTTDETIRIISAALGGKRG
jgi:enoyl-CoA hydratase/carnithine racemase